MRALALGALAACLAGCTATGDAARVDDDAAAATASRSAPARIGDVAPTGDAAAESNGATAPIACPDDAGWNDPATPRRIHGDTYFVGTCGITALLVTSDAGHVLLDAGTERAAPQVLANIRALGFRVEDVEYIVNSHAHHDHAGGIAALQRASGATVVAMAEALPILRSGASTPADPQHGALDPFPGVAATRAIADREVLHLGPLALTAHATPGHMPGGTSWTWRSCEAGRCIDVAFVDSLTAVSAPGYRFSDERAHPHVQSAFRATFERVRGLPCDLLLTPHPQASALWSRFGPGATRPLVEAAACRAYADTAERRLQTRLAEERAAR
jgi:metallo-beta-lactamase class B